MKLNTRHIRKWQNYVFLRRNFWYLLLISAMAVYWYSHYASLAGDSASIQILLSLIILGVCLLALGISLLTTLPAYLAFWGRHHLLENDELEREEVIRILFKEISPVAGWVDVDIRIQGIRKPLWGTVRLKIIFSDGMQSELLPLEKNESVQGKELIIRKSLFLPDIKDYQIQEVILYFEDVFHFFSFPYRNRKNIGIFTEPPVGESEPVEVNLEKAEEPVLKVVQHKLAKGELIDYKKYSPGDDIRRIIWKNYARNRELTVRIPDRSFPYVSHINVLVSFYDASPGDVELPLKNFLLNIYKEKLRQIVDSILEQGFTVNLIADQPMEHQYQLDEYNRMVYYISAAQWQHHTTVEQFVRDNSFRLRSGSNLLVFSSLCSSKGLSGVLNGRMAGLNLCFYRVSRILNQTSKPSFIKQLFLIDILDPLEAARRDRKARKMVKFVPRNEASLEKMLEPFKKKLIEI